MMRTMRENTKWIMLITALAFVALMVFEWGMDASGRSGLGVGQIGSVNGEAVTYDEYNVSYRRIYDEAQESQEEPITSQQVSEIEDRAWDDVVNQLLIRQELARRGIVVTDDEIRQAARVSPPPEFRSSPAFQTDGAFDPQKYQEFLSNPAIDNNLLLALEGYYRDVIPRGKLLRQVSSDIWITDAELWHNYRDQNEAIEIAYLAFNPDQRVDDAEVQATDAEIEAYYRENREDEFSIPAQATVKTIVLNKAPTPSDSLAGEEIAAEYRQRLNAGEVEWEDIEGEGQGARVENLGWFGPDRMVDEFSEAAFAARVGELTEPVRTTFGWHVIDVQERAGNDSVQARHVLVPHMRTNDSELQLLMLADSVEALGEERTIDEVGEMLGLPVQEAQLTTEFAFISVAGQVGEGADWAFEEAEEPGEVSPVFETRGAFYMLELVSTTEAGYLPLEDARASIEQNLRRQKKLDRATAQAEEVLAAIRGGQRFEDAATEAGVEIRPAGPFTRGDRVAGLGRLNAAIGAGFGLNEGEVSDVVQANGQAFILQLQSFIPADSTVFAENLTGQRALAMNQLRQTRLQLWLDGLRESADIVDRRDEVLNQDPDDQPQQFGVF